MARRVDGPGRKLMVTGPDGAEEIIGYDQLVIGTGAVPVRPPIAGLRLTTRSPSCARSRRQRPAAR
jgi:NADPH-dependent 2,4-dienoyl-CoA reductase/sulfur reductase-like enzyme